MSGRTHGNRVLPTEPKLPIGWMRWSRYGGAKGSFVGAVRAWWFEIEPLWIGGLTVALLLSGHFIFQGPWLRLQTHQYEWAQFVVFGLAYPGLLVFSSTALLRSWSLPPRMSAAIKSGLVVLLLACGGVLVVDGPKVAIGAATIQVGLTYLLFRRASLSVKPAQLAAYLVIAILAWSTTSRLFWWEPFDTALFGSLVLIFSFMALLIVACIVLGPTKGTRRPKTGLSVRYLANGAALMLLAVAAFGVHGVERDVAIHHWGVYVGVADLVRQGGWLYWDVPSYYGFLSILTLDMFPALSTWQAFYLLNSSLLFVVGAFVFLLLRALRPGPAGWLLAMSTTLAAVFVTQGASNNTVGIYFVPSTGPYRFIWCYALVAVLGWELRMGRLIQPRVRTLLLGNVIWVIGLLWAPESAVYCSATWLPAYLLAAVWRVRQGSGWREVAALLLVPPILLILALGSLAGIYRAGIGRLPDWAAYVDYIGAFSQGYAEVAAIDPLGPVAGLLFVLSLLGIVAWRTGEGGTSIWQIFIFLAACWGALWSTSSYFMGRGHPLALIRLSPLVCVVVTGIVLLLRQWPADRWSRFVGVGAVPVLVMFPMTAPILANAAGDWTSIAEYPRTEWSLLKGGGNVEDELPSVAPALQSLLTQADVQGDDPIAYTGSNVGNVMLGWVPSDAKDGRTVYTSRGWLPTMPFTLFAPLPEERRLVYLERFIERARLSGWLIQRKEQDRTVPAGNSLISGYGPWIFKQLERSHQPTRIYENEEWQLVWFEYVGEDQTKIGPKFSSDGLEALPATLWVDGQPLDKTQNPATWALYGEGWEPTRPGREFRSARSSADIWIYSPEMEGVELRITQGKPTKRQNGNSVGITLNGAAVPPLDIRNGSTTSIDVDLQAGWNQLTLGHDGVDGATKGDRDGRSKAARGRRGTDLAISRLEIVTKD